MNRIFRRLPAFLNSNGRNDGPPDLDELWRDFNRKLAGLFGGGKGGGDGRSGDGGGSFQPHMKGSGIGIGVGVVMLVLAVGWLLSGFFVVQEGSQGVITSFGKYSETVGAGMQWRLPYPFQDQKVVAVTQLRSVEVGGSGIVGSTNLRDSSMLTEDENIVDVRFTVQYKLKSARDFIFNNNGPEDAVRLAAESAVREIVGKNDVNSVLYEQRDAIAAQLVTSIQSQLDRLQAGIQIVNVTLQSVQPPEQVQAAFEDAFKATQNREQFKNEGEAYENDVVPKAQGTAAGLRQDAEGYKAKVVLTAEGDAARFKSVVAEYQKAPGVTRDRMYIDAMKQVFSNVTKVMVDAHSNNSMLYLPLDKLIQQQSNSTVTVSPPVVTSSTADVPLSPSINPDRSRDDSRSR